MRAALTAPLWLSLGLGAKLCYAVGDGLTWVALALATGCHGARTLLEMSPEELDDFEDSTKASR